MMTRRECWCIFALTLLSTAQCLQFNPSSFAGGDSECALILNGPGRTSTFDYSLNLLRGGNFGYNGPNTCITYDAVNSAYIEARKRIQVAQPHGDWKPEEIATVGELLLDISVNLARTYGLSYEDIEKGLPLIDTSKTLIREVCPAFLSNVECRPGKYRRLDGLCTNLENPTWGSTMQPFTRLIGPLYADGMTAPRISVTGNQLPLARVVSRTMHPDEGFHDHAGTVMVIAWGQFMDHDYTLTGTPLDPLNRNDPEECCKRPPHLKNPYCNEIIIPEDDYFYRLFSVRCLDFVRGFPAVRPGCRLGSRSQFNTLTGVLDANTVYGVSEKFARKLRSGYGGQLRMNPAFREYGLKDLLPLKLDIPDEGCTRPNRSMYCFEAGEIRVNEQLVLTCMHTLMAREHNRVALGLQQVNPHWDDETIYQEARRINIAEVQHITYNEFLPILLGKEVMEKFGLLLQKDGYWDGYDPTVNPNVIDAFAAAAYRFGHSLLPTAVERWSKAHKFIASKRLSDLIRRPYDLYRAGVFDEYFMGLMNQVAQAMDDSITQEVTNHLFKKAGARFGMDLVSFNMQRGREFGLPGYMEFRKFCGLPGAETFEELFGSMPNETIKRYTTIFEHPSDVDLWSGGVSERPLPGSMLGPTFACIIATQFSYSRRGDRFWYELPNQPSTFTPEQLQEIRKARLARVICDNTDLIDSIQLYPMVLPDHEINPRVPCRSGVLPSIDFSKWAEFPNAALNQHQQPFEQNTDNTLEIEIQKATILNIQEIAKTRPDLLQTTKPIKNIKILPAVVLKPPPPLIKQLLTRRTKRSAENAQTNKTDNANSTDQVTQEITVTQVSGDQKPVKFPRRNYHPLLLHPPRSGYGLPDLINEELAGANKEVEEDESEEKEEYNEDEEDESGVYTKINDNYKNVNAEDAGDEENEETEETEDINDHPHKDRVAANLLQHIVEVGDDNLDVEYISPSEIAEKQKLKQFERPRKQEDTEDEPEDDKISDKMLEHLRGIEKDITSREENEDIQESKEESDEAEENDKYTDFFASLFPEESKIESTQEHEAVYPESDSDYEKSRLKALNDYLDEKIGDFQSADEPYKIVLGSDYGFDINKKEYPSEQNADIQNEESQEEINDYDEIPEKGEQSEQESSVVSDYKSAETPDTKSQETESTEHYNYDQNPDSLLADTQIQHKMESAYDALRKILGKRDAISRHEEIKDEQEPKSYSNHWILEYRMPH